MMMITMSWWLWMIVGFALIGVELMIPSSFFIFFCGVGAVIVGVIFFAFPGLSIGMQFLLWSVLSVVLIALLRKRMNFGDTHDGSDQDSLVGKMVTAGEEMGAGAGGRGELRGTTWSIKNVGDQKISAGGHCKVVAVDGLTLNVVSS